MPPHLSRQLVLYYEPRHGTQTPELYDPRQLVPSELLAAWTQELHARSESLRQNRSPSIAFRRTSAAWPNVWSIRDLTSQRSRLPRLELSAVVHMASSAILDRSPLPAPAASALNATTHEPMPAAAVAAVDLNEAIMPPVVPSWLDQWLAELETRLSQPASDAVASAALVYAQEQLRQAARQSLSSLALVLYESYLIFAVWKARQQGDDQRGHRLAIALQELMSQSQAADDHPADTASEAESSNLTGAFLSAVQQLVSDVLPRTHR